MLQRLCSVCCNRAYPGPLSEALHCKINSRAGSRTKALQITDIYSGHILVDFQSTPLYTTSHKSSVTYEVVGEILRGIVTCPEVGTVTWRDWHKWKVSHWYNILVIDIWMLACMYMHNLLNFESLPWVRVGIYL